MESKGRGANDGWVEGLHGCSMDYRLLAMNVAHGRLWVFTSAAFASGVMPRASACFALCPVSLPYRSMDYVKHTHKTLKQEHARQKR